MIVTCFHCGEVLSESQAHIISRRFWAFESYHDSNPRTTQFISKMEREFRIYLCPKHAEVPEIKVFYVEALKKKEFDYINHITEGLPHYGEKDNG